MILNEGSNYTKELTVDRGRGTGDSLFCYFVAS